MTNRVIIMTTEIEVVTSCDLSLNNEVMDFKQIKLLGNEKLAGSSWTLVSMSAYDALFTIVSKIYSKIISKLPEYHVLLFAGNSAWQSDNRIIRYHKLWNALRLKGIEIPHTNLSNEVCLESEGKVKFFGAMKLSDSIIHVAVKVILNDRCTYLVALPCHIDIQEILECGWAGCFLEDDNFIINIYKKNGLLIKRYGEFDDREKGVVIIGKPDLIQMLSSTE